MIVLCLAGLCRQTSNLIRKTITTKLKGECKEMNWLEAHSETVSHMKTQGQEAGETVLPSQGL